MRNLFIYLFVYLYSQRCTTKRKNNIEPQVGFLHPNVQEKTKQPRKTISRAIEHYQCVATANIFLCIKEQIAAKVVCEKHPATARMKLKPAVTSRTQEKHVVRQMRTHTHFFNTHSLLKRRLANHGFPGNKLFISSYS